MPVYVGLGGPASLPPPPGPSVGDAVPGGTANALVVLDASGQILTPSALQYDAANNRLLIDAPIVRSKVSDGTIIAGTFVKASTTTAGRVVAWDYTTDTQFDILGVALTAAGSAGTTVYVVELRGQTFVMKCDGAGVIAKGLPVFFSTIQTGRISGTDNGAYAAIAQSDDPGGTVDALVTVHWK